MASAYPGYGGPQHPTNDGYPYPPPSNMTYHSNSSSTINVKSVEDGRGLARTPSPTPSELRELKSGAIDWKMLGNWRFWIRKEWIWYYVALVLIVVITALVSIFHKQIVDYLTPVTRFLYEFKFGWLVPIAVLFVISFPPLFGHEIVAILCGLVWGLWIGFGIVSAGTFLGEVGNFYAFKYCCRARGEKLERTQMSYACLAKVVRDGGFKIALIARLSAIPGHFTTAVFSACGMGIIVFSIAAILSMPKQFITVYLGVILEQSSTGVKDKKSTIISNIVLAITFIITVVAMWYIFRQMNKVKPDIIYERRKARQAKLSRADMAPVYRNAGAMSSDSTISFNPHSEADIPLTAQNKTYQQWDKEGYAGSSSTETLHAPQPQYGHNLLARSYPKDGEVDGAYVGIVDDHGYEGGHSRTGAARTSTDEVGWDMRAVPNPIGQDPYENTSGYPPGIEQQRNRNNSASRSPPRSPFDDPAGPFSGPSGGGTYHGQEHTDATFHTAMSSMHSREGTEELVVAPRMFSSPPPSSYRTDIR